MWRLWCFDFFVGWRMSFAFFLAFDNSALTLVATFAVWTLYRDVWGEYCRRLACGRKTCSTSIRLIDPILS
jgi:hypothetical protein